MAKGHCIGISKGFVEEMGVITEKVLPGEVRTHSLIVHSVYKSHVPE